MIDDDDDDDVGGDGDVGGDVGGDGGYGDCCAFCYHLYGIMYIFGSRVSSVGHLPLCICYLFIAILLCLSSTFIYFPPYSSLIWNF